MTADGSPANPVPTIEALAPGIEAVVIPSQRSAWLSEGGMPVRAYVLACPEAQETGFPASKTPVVLIDCGYGERLSIEAVSSAIAGRPLSAHEAIPVVFQRPVAESQYGLALGEALAHLHCLWRRGRARRVIGTDMVNPDFVALAQAYGAQAELVEKSEDFGAAYKRALQAGRPALIELRLDAEILTATQTISALRGSS